ncbi:SUKH-3 domain-containing protein [Streptomyces sp. NPDC020965]|uniref:SUKH-3 domain-containing protein n=1 Tax=Streptomyces sp. NPDC020965 TaxID=3365105 RepID=UPI0037A0FCD4
MPENLSTTRFPVAVDAALREAGWQPGRWDIRPAEHWADTLSAYESSAGHRHTVSPAAVEAWAEFGGLRIAALGPGRQTAPPVVYVDPLAGLHLARTLADLGRALDTTLSPLGAEISPLGAEGDDQAVLAIDAEGRVYSMDHTGDWYLGADIDRALTTLMMGMQPTRLTLGG